MGMKHLGIYLSNAVNKNLLIERIFNDGVLNSYIDLAGTTGMLHSPITIEEIIRDELRHDKFPVFSKENSCLASMSSGQQRKALLNYLVEQKPDYIVLDDILSNVDPVTMQVIIRFLEQHAKDIVFIQLFFRKSDLLSFIDTVISIDENFTVSSSFNSDQFSSVDVVKHSVNLSGMSELLQDPISEIDPLIEMNSLSVKYGDKHVLNNISWKIRPGEFWQLKGPVGSGKSTLLSMIFGDNPKGYGQELFLFGRKKGSGETVWDIKKHIGYFYSNMTLLFTHQDTVENMIISGLVDSVGLYTKPSDLQKNLAKAWLEILGPEFKNKRFSELSSGQQRILLVVRAIVKQPPLLILDEPTAGLDDYNTELFVQLINSLAQHRKMAILYVSHRTEANLKPEKVLELIPTKQGSEARIF
jgi:molybdate transport system ATP-binding protein